MTRKKKSGFLTFCFSLMPGAGEMYLGFMKMGISLMGLFFAVMAVSALLNIGTVVLVDVVLWFYSFFHVHNLTGMSDAEFLEVKDEFLINPDIFFDMGMEKEKCRKIMGVILIAAGILLLWNGMKSAFMPWIPNFILMLLSRLENTIFRILLGIGIVIGGIRMIKGKKEELEEVIIDVASHDVKEENIFHDNMGDAGKGWMPEMMVERKEDGTETEHKDS